MIECLCESESLSLESRRAVYLIVWNNHNDGMIPFAIFGFSMAFSLCLYVEHQNTQKRRSRKKKLRKSSNEYNRSQYISQQSCDQKKNNHDELISMRKRLTRLLFVSGESENWVFRCCCCWFFILFCYDARSFDSHEVNVFFLKSILPFFRFFFILQLIFFSFWYFRVWVKTVAFSFGF